MINNRPELTTGLKWMVPPSAHRTGAEKIARIVHQLFLVAILLVTTFHLPTTRHADDTFREGAFLMYGVAAPAEVMDRQPIALRGGIERGPAKVAALFCSIDHQIVCVRQINIALTAVTVGLFLLTLTLITGIGSWPKFLAGLPAVATLVYLNGSAGNLVDIYQGAPGMADLFVVAMLCAAVHLVRDAHVTAEHVTRRWIIGFGFIAGFGLFWSYDLGVTILVLTVIAYFAMNRVLTGIRAGLSMLIGVAIGTAVPFLIGLNRGVGANFYALTYWLQHGDIWWLSWNRSMMFIDGPILLMTVGLFWLSLGVMRRNLKIGDGGQAMLVTLVMTPVVIAVAQMILRTDPQHIGTALAMGSLLAALVLTEMSHDWIWNIRPAVTAMASAAMVFVVSIYGPRPLTTLPDMWSRDIPVAIDTWTGPSPRDIDLVPAGLREAAEAIRAKSPTCTYSFSNEGLLYLLARTPPCSRFAYPVYIASDKQSDVISELERANPPVVLGQSAAWSNDVDGRGLADRTPELAAWLNERYPYRKMLSGGYEVRSREAPPKIAAAPAAYNKPSINPTSAVKTLPAK